MIDIGKNIVRKSIRFVTTKMLEDDELAGGRGRERGVGVGPISRVDRTSYEMDASIKMRILINGEKTYPSSQIP